MIIQGTETVLLKTWSDAHYHQLYKLANNPKIAHNLRDSFPHPYTVHDAKNWISFNQKFNPALNFAIHHKGQLVGAIGGERGKDELRTNIEIGFWLGEPYWGKGIAVEALQLYVEYIFEKFPTLHRLFAQVYDFNTSSFKVLEKAGFEPEAILKKAYIKNGQIGDLFQYVLIRPD
ncbi:GNAT family N-acetyltransferase [Pararhodonellum marinum]|uniref:GNAT family N-acetyltransferase n=1 Tax=Pararhodonellum marinum TaxID=2755358 RepID=UPI0018902BE5|nr:GNAT family N-acetyltransferase [Pararhodonellum marinum]